MRRLITLACVCALAAISAWAVPAAAGRSADPEPGTLSIERGRGIVVLEVRGNVLGRLTNGTVTVTDKTPNDAYVATVTGRRVVAQRRLSPTKVFVRGQGLRFRMLGGSYRIVIHGNGITLSAVGRGSVSIDGEPKFIGDDLGMYSIESDVDCGLEPESCIAISDEPVRLKLAKAPEPAPPEQSKTDPR